MDISILLKGLKGLSNPSVPPNSRPNNGDGLKLLIELLPKRVPSDCGVMVEEASQLCRSTRFWLAFSAVGVASGASGGVVFMVAFKGCNSICRHFGVVPKPVPDHVGKVLRHVETRNF